MYVLLFVMLWVKPNLFPPFSGAWYTRNMTSSLERDIALQQVLVNEYKKKLFLILVLINMSI